MIGGRDHHSAVSMKLNDFWPKIDLLLQVWSERSIQAQLLGAVQNKVPYRKITEKFQKAGFEHTYKQCRDKVKALKNLSS